MKRIPFLASVIVLFFASCRPDDSIVIPLADGETVWGGRVSDGALAPYGAGFSADLSDNGSNQVNPLLLTSGGTYVWSDGPYRFEVSEDRITVWPSSSPVEVMNVGNTLREAFLAASSRHFPADGKLPPSEFFDVPQYNTWIELTYNQNQKDILGYAHGIISHGLPPGILMIDDTWQDDYGKWEFAPGRFPNPGAMIEELHKLGFKVMLWVCPFVSMDQHQICSGISSFDGFLKSADGLPYPVRWWNGTSAVLDFSNPSSVEWFDSQLHRLMDEYGIDGFKFDAADFDFYPEDAIAAGGSVSGAEQCSMFVRCAEKYAYNELRAGWKNAGKAIVQRLHDKMHSWEDLQKLIPEMFAEALLGYSFSCPDMVGGGDFSAFTDIESVDQDLIVRSAQCHALLPMVQFSLAPWRVLDENHYAAVLRAMDIRSKHSQLIKTLFERAATTGEPVIAPLEYYWPHCGLSGIRDEFMLGPDMLVAPMLSSGTFRTVTLPDGVWISDTGDLFSNSQVIEEIVPLDRIPYYIKVE